MLKPINLEKYNWKWKEGTIVCNTVGDKKRVFKIIGRKYSNNYPIYVLHKIHKGKPQKFNFEAAILEDLYKIDIAYLLKKL